MPSEPLQSFTAGAITHATRIWKSRSRRPLNNAARTIQILWTDVRYDRNRRRQIRTLVGLALSTLLVGLIAVFGVASAVVGFRLWHVPSWYLQSRSDVSAGVAMTEYRAANGDIFGALIQGVAGVLVVIGAVSAWQQLLLFRKQQLAEAFGRAIDHLDSDRARTRIQAIRDLQRIAEADREEWWGTVVETLADFLRHQADEARRFGPQASSADLREAIAACSRLESRKPRSPYGSTTGPTGRQYPWHETINLHDVDFCALNLAGVRFTGLALNGAAFRDADLRGARFEHCYGNGAIFDGANLAGAIFDGSSFNNATFIACDFTEAQFNTSVFTNARFNGGKFVKTSFNGDGMLYASFEGAHIEAAKLKVYNLNTASFTNAVLTNVDLRENPDVSRTPALREYAKRFGLDPAEREGTLHWTGPAPPNPHDW